MPNDDDLVRRGDVLRALRSSQEHCQCYEKNVVQMTTYLPASAEAAAAMALAEAWIASVDEGEKLSATLGTPTQEDTLRALEETGMFPRVAASARALLDRGAAYRAARAKGGAA